MRQLEKARQKFQGSSQEEETSVLDEKQIVLMKGDRGIHAIAEENTRRREDAGHAGMFGMYCATTAVIVS